MHTRPVHSSQPTRQTINSSFITHNVEITKKDDITIMNIVIERDNICQTASKRHTEMVLITI